MRTVDRELEQRPGIRRRVGGFISRHRRAVGVAAVVAVGLAIFGFLWFRPDKLFTNTTVDEALPAAQAPAAAAGATAGASPAARPASPAAASAGTQVLSTGRFRDLEHETAGVAKIVRLADGSRYVRFENFRTSSGPDVIVLLSDTPATEDEWGAYDDGRFVSLGPLKGNRGNQNYAIPNSVNLSQYRSVVVWCRRFTVGFGAAPIR